MNETINQPDIRLQYPVMEHFATIQGEGAYSGTPAYFIRIGGCDVGCHWCDVKDSWPLEGHHQTTVDSLLAAVKENKMETVVVTGGEPAMFDLVGLTSALQASHMRTHIETSGAYPISGQWDWVTVSPKKFKPALASSIEKANELKVVIYHKSDFAFAEEYATQVGEDCALYLQPEWSKREQIMPILVQYVKDHPQWRISLQTHKYLNIP